MTVRTQVQSLEGATLSLSAGLPATYDTAGYTTVIVWTAIGQVESYGSHGLTSSVNTFTPVDTGVIAKTKGTKDYGNMSLVIGCVPGDTGQTLIATASESKARYSAKITYPLGDGESTAETHFLDVLVTKREFQDGSANDIRKISVDFAVCRKPVEVAAT